jgi:hypothetical protein
MTIRANRAQCTKCGDIIESTYTHDFKWCSCGGLAVDGGFDYLRRAGDQLCVVDGWKELSIVEEDKENG